MTDASLFRHTFNAASYAYNSGQITRRQWRRYLFAWSWSCSRFSDLSDQTTPTPDRYFRKLGPERYSMRRAQVEAISARIREAHS